MSARGDRKIINVVLAIVVFSSIFFVGAQLFSILATNADATEVTAKSSSPLVQVDSSVVFESDVGYFSGEIREVTQVNDSTGNAIKLNGASDSTYTSDSNITFAKDGTWTLSVWAEFNDTYGTANGTVYSMDGRTTLQYDNTTGEWVGWHYNESTKNSYRVNASAPSQPRTLTNVKLYHNTTSFWISVNGTIGEVEQINDRSIESPIQNASNWAGRQEELRGYDDVLTATQSQQLIDSPIHPVNGANRTLRVMFDEGSGSVEPVYFTNTKLSLSNSTYANGIAGNVLEDGTDYTIDLRQGTITALSGGLLDTAPTVFIDYRFELNPAATSWTQTISDGLIMLTIIPILLVLGFLVYLFAFTNQGRKR